MYIYDVHHANHPKLLTFVSITATSVDVVATFAYKGDYFWVLAAEAAGLDFPFVPFFFFAEGAGGA